MRGGCGRQEGLHNGIKPKKKKMSEGSRYPTKDAVASS